MSFRLEKKSRQERLPKPTKKQHKNITVLEGDNMDKQQLGIERRGRKWFIIGCDSGWVVDRPFPTKWKALIALDVFNNGGKKRDYWEAAAENRPEERIPSKALEEVKKGLKEIVRLDPKPEEIVEYGKNAAHGVVTSANGLDYFGPRLHNTWGEKSGGRVHIDLGSNGVHLMLDKHFCWDFIKFIQQRRAKSMDNKKIE